MVVLVLMVSLFSLSWLLAPFFLGISYDDFRLLFSHLVQDNNPLGDNIEEACAADP